MDIGKALKIVIDHISTHAAKRTKRVESARANLAATIEKIIEIDDLSSDQAMMVHEELKVMYTQLSSFLGPTSLDPPWISQDSRDERLDDLINAICEARIYFWARTFTADKSLYAYSKEELVEIASHSRHTKHLLTSSAITFSQRLLDQLEDKEVVDEEAVIQIREMCLRSLAQFRTSQKWDI